ncbi:MAG: DUF3482 domain-containing protein, partial [Verrucomicrobiota bacterium]
QEHILLERAAQTLNGGKKKTAQSLAATMAERNVAVFDESVKSITTLLGAVLTDKEKLKSKSLVDKAKAIKRQLFDQKDSELEAVYSGMCERLAKNMSEAVNSLIEIHGLDGETAKEFDDISPEEFEVKRKWSESFAAATGGVVTGALTGAAADLFTGGLSGGVGAILGGLAGAGGGYLLSMGYNFHQSVDCVRWNEAHFLTQIKYIAMVYLAVAHFGRGRGVWQDPVNTPQHWEEIVEQKIDSHRERLVDIWKKAEKGGLDKIEKPLAKEVRIMLSEQLMELYPECKGIFA